MLTDRQQQIWNYLVEYVDRHGYPRSWSNVCSTKG